MRRMGLAGLSIALAFAAFVYFNNTNLLETSHATRPTLLAHRGVHQTFPAAGLTSDTCTAKRIYPPEHAFLENTLDSIRAAFAAGAEVVEFDVHRTADGRFAVFHDWTLQCRTNGHGVTRDRTLTELKELDIGYGYTPDGGKTFPFRGKGVGLMPSLEEVLTTFPDKRFLIDIKSNDAADGSALAERLSQLPPDRQALLMVYGGERPVSAVRADHPQLPTATRSSLKSCLMRYIALGWSGFVPSACRSLVVLVPVNYARWLWGWPNRFLERMRGAGSFVFVIGPWKRESFTRGLDTAAELGQLPASFSGGIWTNRVDRIAPLARRAGATD